MKTVTLVVPIYNESLAIEHNLLKIWRVADKTKEVRFLMLLIDDGSTDDTVAKLQAFCSTQPATQLLCLKRNFGKESAIHAGLNHVDSDAVIVIDSDLQHPPDLIERMVELWQQGIDVVEACKTSRGNESLLNSFLANSFYRLFSFFAHMDLKSHSDFKLLDRTVVDAYCQLPESKRFFRGMVSWMGFPSAQIYFDVPERKHGQSSWSRLKLLRFAVLALTRFTSSPLQLVTVAGITSFLFSMLLGGIVLYDKFTGVAVTGFSTVILMILFIGSLIMFALGLIGIYLEQIFDEIKRRPSYLIDESNSRLEVNK